MDKQWKKFAKLSEICYTEMEKGKIDLSVWDQSYEELKKVICSMRKENPNSARELYEIDDNSDFKYEIEGWLEDYRDTLDMMREHAKLQKVCEELIAMFCWKEDSPTDLKFHIVLALQGQEKYKEACEFSEHWYQEEDDNPYAAAALVYAKMGVKDYENARQLVQKLIPEGTSCSDENDVLFGAAEKLFERTGDKQAEEKIRAALDRYDAELEEYFDSLEHA